MFRSILIFILSSLFFVSCGNISLYSIHKNENVIIDRNSRTVAVFDKTIQKYHYPYKKAASQTLISIARTTKNKSLKLTIDIELQKYISSLFKDLSGSLIVMNVNGEILSMSSFPEYDANIFTDGIFKKKWKSLVEDPRKPFVNKNINALYPPGSTITPALGLHYISSQKLKKDFHVNCESSFKVGKHTFICPTKHGYTDVTKAIREGCNDYFYKGAAKLGITDISTTLKRYGLGKQTGIDLPREFHGLIPSKEWKKKKYNKPWYIGETLNTSIGQGELLVTPLQMTQLTALVATGKLPTPHLVQKTAVLKDVLNSKEIDNLPIIQKAMYEMCNHPKGKLSTYINSKVKIAATQGFSQTIKGKAHSWTVSYAPYKNPQYIVTVLIEHDTSSGVEGAKIVSKIYDKLMKLNYIKGEK